jgi:FkbM family methyltransferase
MIDQGLIFDVGAGAGEDTAYYLKKGFKVVAVEAAPGRCAALGARFGADMDAGRLEVLNLSIATASGAVAIPLEEESPQRHRITASRRVGGLTRPLARTARVPAEPLSELFREFGTPRYCKIDLTGGGLIALQSLYGSPDLPPYVSLQSDRNAWDGLVQEFVALGDLGYRRFKLINRSLVPFQSPPEPTLEGLVCDQTFEPGSCGLFGADLCGRWLDAFEAIEAYKTVFLGYVLNSHPARPRHLRLPPPDAYDTHAAL